MVERACYAVASEEIQAESVSEQSLFGSADSSDEVKMSGEEGRRLSFLVGQLANILFTGPLSNSSDDTALKPKDGRGLAIAAPLTLFGAFYDKAHITPAKAASLMTAGYMATGSARKVIQKLLP